MLLNNDSRKNFTNINKNIYKNVSKGSWIQTGSTIASEIMASAGFDWIVVDLEHTETSMERFANIVRTVMKFGVIPMARVSENNTIVIRKVLDCGAMGVIVPLVNNKEDARRAVLAAKYPPVGIRGFAFCQANEWGKTYEEYVKSANDNILIIAMVETKEAVENIDEILSTEGIDGIFIGPYDLSGSYGVTGQTSHELVKQAKKVVSSACKRHNKIAGQHIVMQLWLYQSYQYCVYILPFRSILSRVSC